MKMRQNYSVGLLPISVQIRWYLINWWCIRCHSKKEQLSAHMLNVMSGWLGVWLTDISSKEDCGHKYKYKICLDDSDLESVPNP